MRKYYKIKPCENKETIIDCLGRRSHLMSYFIECLANDKMNEFVDLLAKDIINLRICASEKNVTSLSTSRFRHDGQKKGVDFEENVRQLFQNTFPNLLFTQNVHKTGALKYGAKAEFDLVAYYLYKNMYVIVFIVEAKAGNSRKLLSGLHTAFKANFTGHFYFNPDKNTMMRVSTVKESNVKIPKNLLWISLCKEKVTNQNALTNVMKPMTLTFLLNKKVEFIHYRGTNRDRRITISETTFRKVKFWKFVQMYSILFKPLDRVSSNKNIQPFTSSKMTEDSEALVEQIRAYLNTTGLDGFGRIDSDFWKLWNEVKSEDGRESGMPLSWFLETVMKAALISTPRPSLCNDYKDSIQQAFLNTLPASIQQAFLNPLPAAIRN